MTTSKKPGRGARLWQKFARRHKGNPLLKRDPLYALTEELIDIIAGKATGSSFTERTGIAPNFLTKEEVEFERDLARTTSGGFFEGWPFRCLLLGPAAPEVAQAKNNIKALEAQLLEDEGINPLRVRKSLAEGARYEDVAARRAAAYTGWLVMSPLFRLERDQLREAWGAYVGENEGFPVLLRESFLGFPVERPDRVGKGHAAFMLFYRRWCLQTFLTWELPLPILPRLHGVEPSREAWLSEAGVQLFLPWYILRDGRFRLDELARHLQHLDNPAHLAGWLDTVTERREALGDTRLRNSFILYRYQTLALQSRYAGRMSWHAARQDAAFAQFLGVSEESVRHLRLHLQRRLSDDGPAR
jgi:hypothetical protein